MDLTVMDRALLYGILPAEGDITTLRIVRKLREDLSFSEDENKEFEIVQEEGQLRWNPEKATAKAVEFGPKALKVVVKALKKLSDSDKLTIQYVDLYDKFVTED